MSKILNNEKEYRYFLTKWCNKLGIAKVPIKFFVDGNRTYALKDDKNRKGNALVRYDFKEKRYLVGMINGLSESLVLHEIGHIFQDESTNRRQFDSIIDKDLTTSTEFELHIVHSALIDCFSDYRLSKIPECYEIIKFELFKPETELILYVSQYILKYLRSKFIIGTQKPNEVIQKKLNLTDLELTHLNTTLDKFDTIKESNDYQEILQFIFKVLNSLKRWNKPDIVNYLKLMYKIEFKLK